MAERADQVVLTADVFQALGALGKGSLKRTQGQHPGDPSSPCLCIGCIQSMFHKIINTFGNMHVPGALNLRTLTQGEGSPNGQCGANQGYRPGPWSKQGYPVQDQPGIKDQEGTQGVTRDRGAQHHRNSSPSALCSVQLCIAASVFLACSPK